MTVIQSLVAEKKRYIRMRAELASGRFKVGDVDGANLFDRTPEQIETIDRAISGIDEALRIERA